MENINQNTNDLALNGWVSQKRAMELIACQRSTLYYLANVKKKIKWSKIGSKKFFNLESIIILLNENARDGG